MTDTTVQHGTKILNIQALRGIAVILVIALHIQSNEAKYGHGYTILPDFFSIGHAGVDLFFVISGFVMVTITRGWVQREPDAIYGFLYHRVTRIYPVYWFYSLLMLVIYFMQHQTQTNTRVVDITASFLLLPQNQLPLLVVGWTLVHEMYFYLVFTLLLAFNNRWLPLLLIAWGIVSMIGYFVLPVNPTTQLVTNPLTLEFIFGCFVALAYCSKTMSLKYSKYHSLTLFFIAFVWWLLAYCICMELGVPPDSKSWLRLLAFGFPAAFFVYALVTLERYSGWRLPTWLILIGDASFSIYLSHLLVIATIGRIWEKFHIVGPWINGLILSVMFIGALVVGMISFRLIERPLLKITRRFG